MGLKVLQRQQRAMVWVPKAPDDSTAVLKQLEMQNPGLGTASWKVVAENVGTTTDGRNLVLRIPESSVLKLKAVDFKPYLGLDQVTFKMRGAQDKDGRKGTPT